MTIKSGELIKINTTPTDFSCLKIYFIVPEEKFDLGSSVANHKVVVLDG